MNPDSRFSRFPDLQGNVVLGSGKRISGEGTRDIVLIYGDPEGLRSLARILEAMADLDQRQIPDDNLPPWESFHIHLQPGADCHPKSMEAVIGRLDAKADGSMSWFLDGTDA